MDSVSFKEKMRRFVRLNPIPVHRNLSTEEIDSAVETITHQLKAATESSVKRIRCKGIQPVKLKQITVKCLDMKKEWVRRRTNIDRKFSRGTFSQADLEERNRLDALVKRVSTLIGRQVQTARGEDFKNKIEKIHTGNEMFKGIRQCSAYKRFVPVSAAMNIGENRVSSPELISEAFAEHYAKVH